MYIYTSSLHAAAYNKIGRYVYRLVLLELAIKGKYQFVDDDMTKNNVPNLIMR